MHSALQVRLSTGFRLAADYKLSVTLRGGEGGGWPGVTLCDRGGGGGSKLAKTALRNC